MMRSPVRVVRFIKGAKPVVGPRNGPSTTLGRPENAAWLTIVLSAFGFAASSRSTLTWLITSKLTTLPRTAITGASTPLDRSERWFCARFPPVSSVCGPVVLPAEN